MTSEHRPADRYRWFGPWVHQQLAASLAFTRGCERHEVLGALGLELDAMMSMADVLAAGTTARRAEVADWHLAKIHGWWEDQPDGGLDALRVVAPEVVVVTFTPTISTLAYAADGTVVALVDIDLPHIRHGSDPDRFRAEMTAAGLLQRPADLDSAACAAAFIELAHGIRLEPSALNATLPARRLEQS